MEKASMRSQALRGNVFVANLPPEFGDEQLAEAFDPYGIVLSATIARDPSTGHKLRYGFVDIATERAALLAVAAMNGVTVLGHALDVRISEHKAGKRPPRPPGAARRGAPPPRRPAEPRQPRLRLGADSAAAEGDDATPRPPRKAPNFVVERRPLPRRFQP
jgi:RNA recognition motif-containing protein